VEHKVEVQTKIDWKTSVLTVVSTLLILIGYYHSFTPWKFLDRFILFLLVPLAVIAFVFRESPAAFGFRLGNWRSGLLITLGTCAVLTPLIWLAIHLDGSLRTYYQGMYDGSMVWPVILDLFGWEFLFRGWLLFGYARQYGMNAIWLQAVPFALSHITKPELETLTTIFGGFGFGWLSWKTGSFLYAFLIHWYVMTFTIVTASGGLG
jgi:uncharacterized protein